MYAAAFSFLIGCLGTVFGTTDALTGIAITGSGGVGAVAAGLSEAISLLKYGLLLCFGFLFVSAWAANRADRWRQRLEV